METKPIKTIVCVIEERQLYRLPKWRKLAERCQRMAAGRCDLCAVAVKEKTMMEKVKTRILERRGLKITED